MISMREVSYFLSLFIFHNEGIIPFILSATYPQNMHKNGETYYILPGGGLEHGENFRHASDTIMQKKNIKTTTKSFAKYF